MKQRVLVTGGFDPLHSGHIEYFKSAKALGDELIVGLNSDAWLTRKKGKAFMPMSERKAIVEALSVVDPLLILTIQTTQSCNIQSWFYVSGDKVIFANGGDRNDTTILYKLYSNYPVQFEFGIGEIKRIWQLDT